jgi:chaperonin cofactor prefoldin
MPPENNTAKPQNDLADKRSEFANLQARANALIQQRDAISAELRSLELTGNQILGVINYLEGKEKPRA